MYKPSIRGDSLFSWKFMLMQVPEKGPLNGFQLVHDTEIENIIYLVHRNSRGRAIAIFCMYPNGEFAIHVHPRMQKRGIGTKLLQEAFKIFSIDLSRQRYTESGAAFINSFVQKTSVSGVC